jgi:hypothetical protein
MIFFLIVIINKIERNFIIKTHTSHILYIYIYIYIYKCVSHMKNDIFIDYVG